MDGMEDGTIDLQYTITKLDKGLELKYRVENRTKRAIYLTTPLSEAGEERVRANAGFVYVYVDGEGILQITKRLWPIPEGVDVFMPEVPFLTRVVGGGAFEERVVLEEPVVLRYPYGEEGEGGEGVAEVLGFSVGYMVEEDGDMGKVIEVLKGVEGAGYGAGYGVLQGRQRVLSGGGVAVRGG